jgi:hypothetical protein
MSVSVYCCVTSSVHDGGSSVLLTAHCLLQAAPACRTTISRCRYYLCMHKHTLHARWPLHAANHILLSLLLLSSYVCTTRTCSVCIHAPTRTLTTATNHILLPLQLTISCYHCFYYHMHTLANTHCEQEGRPLCRAGLLLGACYRQRSP